MLLGTAATVLFAVVRPSFRGATSTKAGRGLQHPQGDSAGDAAAGGRILKFVSRAEHLAWRARWKAGRWVRARTTASPPPSAKPAVSSLPHCLFNTITLLTLSPFAFMPLCVAVIVLPSADTATLVVTAGLPSILPMTSNVRSSIRLRAFVVFGA
jgi:hypothetical protein